ncbi:DUF983 domain-containing protein [soil metagenome]
MSLKEGAPYSILYSKCPKCNIGNLYVDNNMYHLKKLGEMNKRCDYCGQLYEPETGFYYGAMYVSYGVSIIGMFLPAFTLYFLFDLSFAALLGVVLGIYILAFPLFFRISRNIWLNMFVKFSPHAKAEALKKKS